MSLYDYNEYVTKSQKAQTDRNKALTWLFVTLMALLLAVGSIFYLISLYKKKQRDMQTNAMLLESLTSPSQLSTDHKEAIKGKISMRLLELLNGQQKNHINDSEWNELIRDFQVVYPDFFLKLNGLGKFNTSEMRVFVLIRLGLTPHDISTLANISPQAVSSIRSRAYKKIMHKKGSPAQMDEILMKL